MRGSTVGRPAGAVEVRSVRKRFARRGEWVLDRVDLVLEPGSTTVVIGANAAGKSTLLRVVAGVLDPTTGRVVRGGATIGYAPDRLGTRVRMSARVYVEHMARLRGLDPAAARTRADELFARLGLRPGPDEPIRSLSKGNSQKVALTQALLAPVDLLLLDEPYSGLDEQARAAMSEIIVERAANGGTVLVSAHTRLDALSGARQLRLDRGQVGVDAPPGRDARATRVALSHPDIRSALGAVRERAGVLDVNIDTTLADVEVRPAAVDDLLRFVLDAGWSVVSVDPAPGDEHRHA